MLVIILLKNAPTQSGLYIYNFPTFCLLCHTLYFESCCQKDGLTDCFRPSVGKTLQQDYSLELLFEFFFPFSPSLSYNCTTVSTNCQEAANKLCYLISAGVSLSISVVITCRYDVTPYSQFKYYVTKILFSLIIIQIIPQSGFNLGHIILKKLGQENFPFL